MDLHLAIACQAAQEAGKRLLELYGTAEVRQKESSRNLVTQADLEAEEIITGLIASTFPDHRFLCEEGPSTGGADDEHLWIIDPLDATNNYAHGIPHFSVSIAYAERGEILVGAVLDPLRRELFTAVKGRGATLNDKPIRVSDATTLDESIVATGFYYDRGMLMRKTLAAIDRLFTANVRGMRRMGSAAIDLSWVACGRFEGFFEYQLAPWDYAAGKLLIEEAGGRCSDRSGAPLTLQSNSVLTAAPGIFETLQSIVLWTEG